MMRSRKGGVTIYIVLGLVILFIGLLGIVFADNLRQAYLESRNPEVKDLRLSIESCLNLQLRGGVQIASLQGGYIEIPDRLDNNFAYLPPAPAVTKTPYWFFRGISYVPTKEKVEQELSNYVKDNLDACLSLQDPRLSIEVEGDSEIKVTLAEKRVSSILDLPLKVTFGDKELKLNKFSTDMESSFLHLLEAGKEIMELENERAFLETLTMDMIAGADGAGDSPHLPLDGYEIRCGSGNRWSEQLDIIPDLQRMAKYNFHYLSFKGMQKDYDLQFEDNREIVLDVCVEEEDGVCKKTVTQSANILDYYQTPRLDNSNGYVQELDSKTDFSDVKVRVEYDPSFSMDLDVSPSRGDSVKGFNLDIPVLGSCFKMYHHFYDIEYPVLFHLTGDDGSSLSFVTPVIIDKNKPQRSASPYSLGEYIYSPDVGEYCDNRINQKEIFVKDEITSDFIDGAEVSYQCVRFNCELGSTEAPKLDGVPISGSVPVLKTGFPSCTNGFVIVNKDGYQEKVEQLTIDGSSQSLPAIELTPVKNLEVKVTVLEPQGNNMFVRSLKDEEAALISITKLDEVFDDSYLFRNDGFADDDFQDALSLLYKDGSYEVDVKLINGEDLIGGLLIDSWTVTRNELSGANYLKFYVIAPSEVTDIDTYVDAWTNVIVPRSQEFAPILG